MYDMNVRADVRSSVQKVHSTLREDGKTFEDKTFLGSCARDDTAIACGTRAYSFIHWSLGYRTYGKSNYQKRQMDSITSSLFNASGNVRHRGHSSLAFSKLLVLPSPFTLLIERECAMCFAISVCD